MYIVALKLPGDIEAKINDFRNILLKESREINSIYWPTFITLAIGEKQFNLREKQFYSYKFNLNSRLIDINNNLYLDFNLENLDSNTKFQEIRVGMCYLGKSCKNFNQNFSISCKSAKLIQYKVLNYEKDNKIFLSNIF